MAVAVVEVLRWLTGYTPFVSLEKKPLEQDPLPPR